MQPHLIDFPNKFRAVICAGPLNSVTISASICAGAEQEPKSQAGITHLLERLFRIELSKSVAPFGGISDTRTDFEHIEISITTLPRHLESALNVLSNVIFDFHPKQDTLERERNKIMQEIEKESFNPLAILNNCTQKYMYKGTHLSTNVLGNFKTIESITLEDVKNYYFNILAPSNLMLSVVGQIFDGGVNGSQGVNNLTEQDYAQELINKYFYIKTIEQNGKKRARSTAYCIPANPIFIAKQKPLNQTRFQISFPSAPYNSTGYKYSKLLQIYLNIYLRMELSATRGVYGIDVNIHQFKNNSHMAITFAVDREIASSVYNKIILSLKKLKSELVSKNEFLSLVSRYKTEVAKNHQTTLALALRFNKWLFLKEKLFELRPELDAIDALVYEGFTNTTKLTLDFNHFMVAVLGKKEDDFNPFEILGGTNV